MVENGSDASLISLTLSYLSKINGYLYPQKVSPPLKKRHESNTAHPVKSANSNDSLMRFFEFELLGRV
jgi:hypothetical protein